VGGGREGKKGLAVDEGSKRSAMRRGIGALAFSARFFDYSTRARDFGGGRRDT